MFDETPLNEAVSATLSDYLAADGGGMVTDYVLVARAFDKNGEMGHYVVCPDLQPASTSLGLMAYGGQWFEWDVRASIAAHVSQCDCDDEDD